MSKRRIVLLLAAVVITMLAFAIRASAFSTTHHINDNFFDPETYLTSPTLNPANAAWDWGVDGPGGTTNTHNVREDHKLFYSGDLTSDSFFDIQASAGTYHYYCEHHGSPTGGMDGVIKSKPRGPESPTAGLDEIKVEWAFDTDTGDRFDVQYRVNGGDWRTWKNDTANFSGLFGHNDRPLDVKDGKTYTFRARTEKSSNVDVRRSRWSPKLNVAIPTV